MEMRTLGPNALAVSAIGFGCMGMSQSFGPNPGDRSQMIDLLRTAVDRGLPPVVRHQVRLDELEARVVGTTTAYGGPHRGAACGRAHRRTDRVPVTQESRDQMGRQVAGTAGDQDHRSSPTTGTSRRIASASAVSSPRSRASQSSAFPRRYVSYCFSESGPKSQLFPAPFGSCQSWDWE